MGITAAVIAIGATGYSMSQAEDAEDKQYAAAQEQKKSRQEQDAMNASQAAAERRRQVREERVRQARVMQASQAAGTTGSSGEMGASFGMATNLSANIGQNLGALQSANNISIFSQNAANLFSEANALQADSQFWGQVGGLAMQGASAFGSMTSPSGGTQVPAPISDRSIR